MTNQHPITPPQDKFDQWEDNILNERENDDFVLDCVWKDGFQTGADQELEACLERILDVALADQLRAARRPNPPSLKEQALAELDRLIALIPTEGAMAMAEPIRKALEALPND